MRISALSEATAVPVATLKYYLREGLLHPGEATSRTQAVYDASHVERVRLVRALREAAGLDLATIARLLRVIDDPGRGRLDVLGSAQRALSGTPDLEHTAASPDDDEAADPTPRATALVRARGWLVAPDDPVLSQLETALAACERADIGLDAARLEGYAAAVERIAALDLEAVPEDPDAAARQVVLGTVLVDPVLVALRRLAQQDAGRRSQL